MSAALEKLDGDATERKRSVVLAGHRTSVSVEPLFWNEMRQIADGRGVSLNGLVAEVDRAMAGNGSLSSALRVFTLKTVRASA